MWEIRKTSWKGPSVYMYLKIIWYQKVAILSPKFSLAKLPVVTPISVSVRFSHCKCKYQDTLHGSDISPSPYNREYAPRGWLIAHIQHSVIYLMYLYTKLHHVFMRLSQLPYFIGAKIVCAVKGQIQVIFCKVVGISNVLQCLLMRLVL